jgi:hypothetical protein
MEVRMSDAQIIELIIDRQKTHGRYEVQSTMAQKMKGIFQDAPNWDRLSAAQKESLHMIAAKIARILCGNPQCVDHWRDCCGYAQLIVDELEDRKS